MSSESQELVVAILLEELRILKLDEISPIEGDVSKDLSAAAEFLDRRKRLTALEVDLLELQSRSGEALGDLISLAATAIEMWARNAGADPVNLLEEIAAGWHNALSSLEDR